MEKRFGLVGCNFFAIGSRDGSNDEGFRNVDAATERVHNFEYKHSLSQMYSARISIDCSSSTTKEGIFRFLGLIKKMN